MPLRRYYAWCKRVQSRLKRWHIIPIGFGLPIAGFLIIASLPRPFLWVFVPLGGVAFFAWSWFLSAHMDYWSKKDEWLRSDSYKRTMKVRDIVDKTYRKRK